MLWLLRYRRRSRNHRSRGYRDIYVYNDYICSTSIRTAKRNHCHNFHSRLLQQDEQLMANVFLDRVARTNVHNHIHLAYRSAWPLL